VILYKKELSSFWRFIQGPDNVIDFAALKYLKIKDYSWICEEKDLFVLKLKIYFIEKNGKTMQMPPLPPYVDCHVVIPVSD